MIVLSVFHSDVSNSCSQTKRIVIVEIEGKAGHNTVEDLNLQFFAFLSITLETMTGILLAAVMKVHLQCLSNKCPHEEKFHLKGVGKIPYHTTVANIRRGVVYFM